MSKKTAIIIRNCKNIESKKYLYDFCPNILVNTVFDTTQSLEAKFVEQFVNDNNLDGVMIMEDEEELVYFDKSLGVPYICLTDGEWITKPARVFSKTLKHTDNPSIIKTANTLSGPKIDQFLYKDLFNLYQEKNYTKFAVDVEKYFFHNPSMIPKSVMLHYYAAVVYFLILKNTKKCLSHVCQALIASPSMSELWCLWADVLVESKKYSEAYHIYDTAVLAGKNRNIYDQVPVWLKKYEEYPESMKVKIKKLMDNTQVFEIMQEFPRY